MKRIVFLFSLLIIGCKPDEPPIVCEDIYIPLSQEHLSFINSFESFTSFYYKNNNDSIILFNNTGSFVNHIYDTLENVCYKYDYKTFGTYNNNLNWGIGYDLLPLFVDSNNFIIKVGPNQGLFECESRFKFTIESAVVSFDTLLLLNKTFYDVYHGIDNIGCIPAMYYNKQYGVVGFNWQGEWYVLETDSL